MQQKPHRLERNKSSFLCPGAGEGALAPVAAPSPRPSKEVLLAETAEPAAPSREGRGGPEMPSGARARVPAPLALSRGVRLPGLRETS